MKQYEKKDRGTILTIDANKKHRIHKESIAKLIKNTYLIDVKYEQNGEEIKIPTQITGS